MQIPPNTLLRVLPLLQPIQGICSRYFPFIYMARQVIFTPQAPPTHHICDVPNLNKAPARDLSCNCLHSLDKHTKELPEWWVWWIPTSPSKDDGARRKRYRAVQPFMEAAEGMVVHHPVISFRQEDLFRVDGVHLSFLGQDVCPHSIHAPCCPGCSLVGGNWAALPGSYARFRHWAGSILWGEAMPVCPSPLGGDPLGVEPRAVWSQLGDSFGTSFSGGKGLTQRCMPLWSHLTCHCRSTPSRQAGKGFHQLGRLMPGSLPYDAPMLLRASLV